MFVTSQSGIKLHCQQTGEGPDVVMVHGLAANLAFWYMRIVPLLARRYRVTVFDLRGHGLSSVPTEGYSTADMAGDIAFLMDELGISRAHLVGHSLGGAISLHFAVIHPERVLSLSLVDCRIHDLQPLRSPDDTEYWWQRRRDLQAKGIDVTESTPKVVYMMLDELAPLVKQGVANPNALPGLILTDGLWDPKSRGAKRWFRLVQTTSFANDIRSDAGLTREAITKVKAPTLLVYGGASYCMETCYALENALSDRRTVIHPGRGHFFPVVEPELLAHDVLGFLEGFEQEEASAAVAPPARNPAGLRAREVAKRRLRDGGMTLQNFRPAGQAGCGDQRNSYVQGMEWFRDALYVGTFRDSLCLMKRPNRSVPPPNMEFWPVNCPDPECSEFMRGEILRHEPGRASWEVAYRSPMIELDGKSVMRDVGYRAMIIFQGKSDPVPCLYTGSISATGCRVLRSTDGRDWHETAVLDGPSVRSLVPSKGRLYTSVVGQTGKAGNEGGVRPLLASDDPASGVWYPVSEPGFGDPSNVSVFEMAEFNGFLYASTMNPTGGMQVFKSDCEGPPPFKWTRVITAGAYRGFLNEYGISMCEFDGHLYIGTGIAGGGYDRLNKVGPAPAEVIRLLADDTWELVVGAPRITPDGVKAPISGMLPGFNNFLNGYMWRMCVHDGWLYVGTFNGAAFMKYRPHKLNVESAEQFQRYSALLATSDLDEYLEQYGGCHLWRTRDGVRWAPVTRNGFGSQYNMGIRQMTSSPAGLFVGVCNPFGPQVGVQRDGRWVYEDNPRGGIEVWCGIPDVARRAAVHERPRGETRTRCFERALTKAGRQIERQFFSIVLKDFYGDSGFDLIGLWDEYWRRHLGTPVEANEALLDFLVKDLGISSGVVLDVGCGKGASTAYLRSRLPGCHVVGIDELGWSIDFGLSRRKDLDLSVMDPARMDFRDSTFDAVVCAERAMFIDTREEFLREAHRVLKPGGRFVATDLLLSGEFHRFTQNRYAGNLVDDVEAYRGLLTQAGFADECRVEDITLRTLTPYIERLGAFALDGYKSRAIEEGRFHAIQLYLSKLVLFARGYIVARAYKPLVAVEPPQPRAELAHAKARGALDKVSLP